MVEDGRKQVLPHLPEVEDFARQLSELEEEFSRGDWTRLEQAFWLIEEIYPRICRISSSISGRFDARIAALLVSIRQHNKDQSTDSG